MHALPNGGFIMPLRCTTAARASHGRRVGAEENVTGTAIHWACLSLCLFAFQHGQMQEMRAGDEVCRATGSLNGSNSNSGLAAASRAMNRERKAVHMKKNPLTKGAGRHTINTLDALSTTRA